MNNNPQMLLLLFCVTTLLSCTSEEIVADFNATPKISSKSIEVEILNEINNYRIANGFSKLNQLAIIKTQTNNHTNYMVSKSAISHDNFYTRKQYLTANANAKNVVENVAYGYSSAKTVVNAWLKSTGHKKNIEGNYNYFEISAEKDKNGKWYYTNIFIKK